MPEQEPESAPEREQHEQARLFEPAPNQLAGQTHFDTDAPNERPENHGNR